MPNGTFCPLLWNHLNTHPDGGASFCCISKYENNANRPRTGDYVYNLNQDSIHSIMNSDSYKTARLQMLNGEKPDACMRCYQEEDAGVGSRREYKSRILKLDIDTAKEITNTDGSLEHIPLEFVELRLGNTCNLQCRSCDSSSSSKWRNDYAKLGKELSFTLHNNIQAPSSVYDWVDNDVFWADLLSYSDTLHRFSINGGEPTLIKKQFRFLQKLIDEGKTDYFLRYNINVTNLDESMIAIWKQFNHVQISCSIDDIGERNEYIRWPTKWDTIIKNLNRLIQENFEIVITHTISFMNYCNVVNYYKYFAEHYPAITIIPNFVEKPHYLSPHVIPIELRNIANAEIADYFSNNDYMYKKFLNIYNQPNNSKLWENAKEFTNRVDKMHNVNITDFLPEFNGHI